MNTTHNRCFGDLDGVRPKVRFSLADLLVELEREQTSGAFNMETLSQAEITKLFETKRSLRAAKP